ncbi:C4-dicarboxylate transporter DctA [Azospirillum argentinense]|uniref:C4-dicarboxylate transporter DctA n=2 Tax=Azospirillum TaxID=191 RepID=A0A2K1FRQ6_9PROT|nr:C4-dicarboxylate transporter DctA [Azospirillum argentinense]KAA1056164.1 Na+/H+-dicarboxylate symporter [Azospirillum argentinense]MBK3802467.1 C4-dicarboxylate transporter DctA [Azospirillum argentinense]PNQ95218.1 dicarboxylate/amino acid:cation symporter [Azospirillum argentinense]QCO03377.1 C4-dicarboxylate transporter DctA [Azospirillum argentinense]
MRLQTGEQTPAPTKPKAFYKALYFQVVVGLTLGILAGHFWPDFGASLKPLGDGFVKLVKMMIAPVVFCTIVSGITSLNDTREIGKTLVKSMALFYALTVAALLIGLAAVMIIEPGVGMHVSAASLDPTVAARYAKQAAPVGFTDFVLHIIPHSFFGAFAEGEVLPVLLISVLVGFGLTRVGKAGEPVVQGIESFSHVLFAAFGFIMKLAPIGAFGAMAFTVGKYGIDSIGSLGLLILTFYVACSVFLVVIIGTLARLHGFSLWKVLRYFREELLIVLGTSSSEPVLPRVLQKLEALGCKKGVSGLVLPMGYSFNLDGTAIYLTLASLFIAQACDIHLSGGQIFAMLGVMLLTSKGAAGVTGSGFVALVATLTVMPDLPVAGVALLVGIDRFMSEARALTSIISNCVASIVVSIWENACDREVLQRELNQSYASTERCLEEKGDIAVLPLTAPAQPSH